MAAAKDGSKVRLEDIAKKLGVSKMTVSLALRNDFAVAEATRAKVKALAEKMGYRRDPLLSIHMSKLRRGGSTRFRPKLAFLNPHSYRDKILESPAQTAFLKGSQERAAELGYEVEELWLGDDALKTCSLKTYFKRRGIHGFISLGEPLDKHIPWDCFPSVVVGYTMTKMGLHRVCNNQRRSAQMLIKELSLRGFKRVTMAMREELDKELDENYSSAFLSAQSWLPEDARTPLYRPAAWDKKAYFKWLDAARPDAVAGLEVDMVVDWTLEYNKVSGKSVAPVALAHNRNWAGFYGVDQRSVKVGASALEIVVQQITMGLSGIPSEPTLILLEGQWVDATDRKQAKG